MIVCLACNTEKYPIDFATNRKTKELRTFCKVCTAIERSKLSRSKDSSKLYQKKYKEDHADKIKKQSEAWEKANRDYRLLDKREYYKNNRKNILEKKRMTDFQKKRAEEKRRLKRVAEYIAKKEAENT